VWVGRFALERFSEGHWTLQSVAQSRGFLDDCMNDMDIVGQSNNPARQIADLASQKGLRTAVGFPRALPSLALTVALALPAAAQQKLPILPTQASKT
jgi:hypothetical protein